MTTEKLNIEAVVEKVNFMQKQFVIAKVIKSSHETYNEFAFKGFSNKKINVGDHVLITKGYFNETKYGIQIENGSLVVIKKSLDPKDKVNNIKVNNNIVINQENKNFNTEEIQEFKLTNEQIKCINAIKSGDDIKIKAYAGTAPSS